MIADEIDAGHQIRMSGVEVSYPLEDGGRKVIIDELHMQVRMGEIVTIVGPSGCGKSTVLRMIFGNQFPVRGVVAIDGNAVTRVTRDQGMVFQKYSLFPHLTVAENIGLGILLEETNLPQRVFHTPGYWRARKRARQAAMEFLPEIGLEPGDGRKYPGELSGGMRQRVAIAQALVMRPKVLLLDEVTSALDEATAEDILITLLELWEKKPFTCLFVTHRLSEAVFFGSRVIGLSQYWTHDDGRPGQGAKIVFDQAIPGGHPKPIGFKSSREFAEIRDALRDQVLNPDQKRKLSQFNIRHQDGWHPQKGWNGGTHAA